MFRVTNWPARPAALASSREKWPLLSVSLIYSLYSPVISFLISLNSHIFTLIFTILQSNGVGQVVDDEGDSAYFGTTSGDVIKVVNSFLIDNLYMIYVIYHGHSNQDIDEDSLIHWTWQIFLPQIWQFDVLMKIYVMKSLRLPWTPNLGPPLQSYLPL